MHTGFNHEVFEKVVQAIKQTVYMDESRLTLDSRLADDLRLGWFGRVRLVLYLEEMFDIEVSDEALEQFDTIGDIVRYMDRWPP